MKFAAVKIRPAHKANLREFVTYEHSIYRRGEPVLVNAAKHIMDLVADKTHDLVWSPDTGIAFIDDATVFDCGFVKAADTIILETLTNQTPQGRLGQLFIEDEDNAKFYFSDEQLPVVQEPTVLISHTWGDNYGHWIVDCLSRLQLASRVVNLKSVKIAVNYVARMKHVYLQSLKHFGVNENQVIWLSGKERHFKDLIVPLPVTRQPWHKSAFVIEASNRIREAVLSNHNQKALNPLKLYVSRSKAARRRLINEGDVIKIVQTKGYEIIHPEDLSFDEQVYVFSRATHVIGVLGAAMTNATFCFDRIKILALTNPAMVDDFFYDLIGLKKGKYISLHGELISPESQPGDGYSSDFSVNVWELSKIIDENGFS